MISPGSFQQVFISGGSGFIGGHLARRLLADGSLKRLVVFDNFSGSSADSLAGLRGDARLHVVRADLKAREAVAAAMEGCETIFHLAANPDIAKGATQPDLDFWEGTLLAQNVLEAMRSTGARRLLYLSGSGVYGENAALAFPEDHGPCQPISTYGASKLACEALISAYCHLFDFRARVVRLANVVGPRQTHGVGYDFVRRLAADPTRLRILGDGTQRKSYLHIEDALEAVFLAAGHSGPSYDVFNVATEDTLTTREIAGLALEACGLAASGVVYEFTGGDRGWRGDVPAVRLDSAKIRQLGWGNRRTSAEAMTDAMVAMRAELPHNRATP
jgi:UDP-glucose 4-epimerase